MPTNQEAQRRKKAISCRGKAGFPTEEIAQKVAGRMNSKGKHVKPYKCDICGKFHVCKREKASVLADLFKEIERQRRNPS